MMFTSDQKSRLIESLPQIWPKTRRPVAGRKLHETGRRVCVRARITRPVYGFDKAAHVCAHSNFNQTERARAHRLEMMCECAPFRLFRAASTGVITAAARVCIKSIAFKHDLAFKSRFNQVNIHTREGTHTPKHTHGSSGWENLLCRETSTTLTPALSSSLNLFILMG